MLANLSNMEVLELDHEEKQCSFGGMEEMNIVAICYLGLLLLPLLYKGAGLIQKRLQVYQLANKLAIEYEISHRQVMESINFV